MARDAVASNEPISASIYKTFLIGFGSGQLVAGIACLVTTVLTVTVVPGEEFHVPALGFQATAYGLLAGSLSIATGFCQIRAVIASTLLWSVISLITSIATGGFETYLAIGGESSMFIQVHASLAASGFLSMIFALGLTIYCSYVYRILKRVGQPQNDTAQSTTAC